VSRPRTSVEVGKLLIELIKLDSVNPSLAEGGRGEGAVAARVAAFCEDHEIACVLEPIEADRANVLASVPGRGARPLLLFAAHMDTVPVTGWVRDPFEAEREGTRIYGRGACDTKGSLAAMLVALAGVRGERPRATIVVAGTVDEEHRKAGARALAASGTRYEAAVIGEPTSLDLVVAHKGSVRWRIETRGRAAHTSKPHLGVNAITRMARVITALEERLGPRYARRAHPLVGPPTLTVSLINGGSHLCIVPDRCEIGIDRRLVPGELPQAALAEVEEVLAALRREDPTLDARSILPAAEDPAVEAPADSRIAQVAARACAEVAGTGEPRGVPYGTDASQLAPTGMDCVVVGPGSIDQAHTTDEYVELSEVEAAVEIYRRIMLAY
jgi:acetylornithine deacetylase